MNEARGNMTADPQLRPLGLDSVFSLVAGEDKYQK